MRQHRGRLSGSGGTAVRVGAGNGGIHYEGDKKESGADAPSLINTTTGMRIDVKKRAVCVANKTGGLSGSAIKPVALRMVWQTCRAVDIPVIWMGGIQTVWHRRALATVGIMALYPITKEMKAQIMAELEERRKKA